MHQKFDDLGRFADPSLLILTSLADGPRHGHAIMKDIVAFSGVKMEPGTLYGALTRLERRGWIRPLPADARRRTMQRELEWMGTSPSARRSKSKARIAAYNQMVEEEQKATLDTQQIVFAKTSAPTSTDMAVEAPMPSMSSHE